MSALLPTYQRTDVELVKGQGSIVEDATGKTYLDFIMGIAVCNTGHRHPYVQQRLEEQLNRIWHTSNLFQIAAQERVAERLTEDSHLSHAFFCNSGAEANEAAYKLVRKWTGKTEVVTFKQSFHGRTFAMMGATGQEKIKAGYGEMVNGFKHLPFNEMESLSAITDQTAAVWLEIIQGEGGVVVADDAWLEALMKKAQQYDVKIIVDEVQTGIGRTGSRFAFEQTPLVPDIITLAKGLGSGLAVGALLATEEAAEVFTPGSHGSTFGGNPLAMTAAEATLDLLLSDTVMADIQEKGEYLRQQLEKKLPKSIVSSIRGRGLMIGIECTMPVAPLIDALRENGLLVVSAGPHVIRLLPSLFVTEQELTQAIEKIQLVCQQEVIV
ncbi:MAG TPA: acetylornithine transaminase [Exiguobacterium sp.]|uniref:acetylornithine transaminase n=1 Tax=unclassified Exiguobacterium TaxID=2644629 RepID=UPI0006F377FC|nr:MULTISPECIES: acetylornithine transaminase [unclassified Exiguobacterium]KQS38018.1 acetylornithine aminotransferase [Exiguobacterium sp. Leaf196]HAB33861.1 acetylornithine transaminase [Exiguobacterium sp.]